MMLRWTVLILSLCLTLAGSKASHGQVPGPASAPAPALIQEEGKTAFRLPRASLPHEANFDWKNHSFILGFPHQKEMKIFEATLTSSGKAESLELEVIGIGDGDGGSIKFPPDDVTNNKSIKRIEVTDERADAYGGFVLVTQGGLLFKYVQLAVLPQFNNPYKFLIKIFGFDP